MGMYNFGSFCVLYDFFFVFQFSNLYLTCQEHIIISFVPSGKTIQTFRETGFVQTTNESDRVILGSLRGRRLFRGQTLEISTALNAFKWTISNLRQYRDKYPENILS